MNKLLACLATFLVSTCVIIDYTENRMKGLQSGMLNCAKSVTGVELGFLNYTEDVEAGCQIGIINIIRSNKTWFSDFPNSLAPFMIFVNW